MAELLTGLMKVLLELKRLENECIPLVLHERQQRGDAGGIHRPRLAAMQSVSLHPNASINRNDCTIAADLAAFETRSMRSSAVMGAPVTGHLLCSSMYLRMRA